MAVRDAPTPQATGHKPHAAHLRQRSTAAVVLSRDDAPAPSRDSDRPRVARPTRQRRWPAVLTWIVLGAAIVALWVLLLAGDSLRATG